MIANHTGCREGVNPPTKILLTEAEAAAALGVCPRRVWQWGHDGALRRTQVGRSVRFHIQDVQDFAAKLRDAGDDNP